MNFSQLKIAGTVMGLLLPIAVLAQSLPAPRSTQAAMPASPANASSLPMLYQSLEAFDTAKHRGLTLPAQLTDFGFAASTDVIPIVVSEVAVAQRHFGLIFMQPEGARVPTLVALVGTGDGRNQFVAKDGAWRAGAYVPAWVRRYPFFMVEDGKGARVLALDTQAAILKQRGTLPLLDKEGKPTDLLKSIVQFQNEYATLFQRTQAMGQALQAANVLEPATLSLRLPGQDNPKKLDGFLIVSEQKLRQLSPEALEKLHKADALGLAYAQLFSLPSLQTLISR